MALEDDLKTLATSINKLIEKLPNGALAAPAAAEASSAAPATTAAAAPATRGPGRPRKITLDEVRAVANKLSAEKGRPTAVKLISEHGAGQLADMEESKYSSFIAAAELLLKQQPESADL